jgi:hypothetical protein
VDEKGKDFFLTHIYIPQCHVAAYFVTTSLIILQFFSGVLSKVISISRSGVAADSSLP